jgi:hypothetical protein
MLLVRTVAFLSLFYLASGCAQRHSPLSGQWVDLTYDFSPETVY